MLGSARAARRGRRLAGAAGQLRLLRRHRRSGQGIFARASAAGAEILAGLHETDYGSRDFAVRDPEGNRWSFGTYRGEPRKGTAG